MNQSFLKIRNLTKEFLSEYQAEKVIAVNNFNLEIRKGEFVTLLGPSGCGKTTTLRMIGGFETPTKGDIYLDDAIINDIPPNKRDTCMVFQSYALFPHMNIFENVAFGLEFRNLTKGDIKTRVEKILELVGLCGMENRPVSQLSGGQQQRVALARAMVNEPKVLLFDEPLSNLDAKLRMRMRIFIRKIQQEANITSVYVTHDQEEAMTLSDRIVVMNHGDIEQAGTPEEIYARPKSKFVADFIGKQANFVTGLVVESIQGRQEVKFWDRTFPFRGYDHLKKGDAVILVIRPEMIGLSDQEGICNGVVSMVTYLGSEVNYEVAANGQVFAVEVSNPLKKGVYHKGDKVCLNFDLDNIYLVKE
ncbi:MAG: ABC transporter ATP-binding protein [Smithellaceae bacterium]|nr:ABC transporter ATP-binding protein [Smithellaceae bacterium]